MRLLSLFDGSAGFPLAAAQCGIEPVMASEVEPYPIAVSHSRFPRMLHLGDVARIDGRKITPVDVITFGSPCQDLSVAGKRAGLKHAERGDEETTRSGLFMEAIRIIKEMRDATNGRYPTFAVWENVVGAFSSNKGEDFRIVLEEFVSVVEPSAEMPAPDKGKWPYADAYVGDGWSVAYRTLDAQYWGVPQRRRRIYLVADFRGERASKVLFERDGLRGYPAQGGTQGETPATDPEGSTGAADRAFTLQDREGKSGGGKGPLIQEEKSASLRTNNFQTLFAPIILENHPNDSRVNIDQSGTVQTLTSAMGTGGGNVPMICEPFCKSCRAKSKDDATTWKHAKVANTLNTFGQGEVRCNELVVESANTAEGEEPVICLEGDGARPSHRGDGYSESGKMFTLNTVERHAVDMPIHDKATRYAGKRGDKHDGSSNGLGVGEDGDPMYTLDTQRRHACFTMQGFGDYKDSDVGSAVKARDFKDATDLVIGIDRAAFNQGQNAQYDISITEEQSATVVAKGPNAVCCKELATPQYVVRRLTPLECNRLQGFPDGWGNINHKDDFPGDECNFWADVRRTYEVFSGKTPKEYTKEQLLKWHNNLHTDSAEYKMWGNGICLQTAQYVMEGIAEALRLEEDNG